MAKKIVKITGKILDEYVAHLRSGNLSIKSLNEFVQGNEKEPVIADLSGFDFAKHPIDFRGVGANANFTGSILKNINFDGKHVVIKGAIMPDASLLEGSNFTNQIDLSGVNFGSIKLNRAMFEDCQMANAIYDPRAEKKVYIKLTETQINDYLLLSRPRPNINHFLDAIIGDEYPNLRLVADLSGTTIDARFNGADLSYCKLDNVKLTGKITALNISNCKNNSITFKDCELEKCDLRNTSFDYKNRSLTLNKCKLSLNKNISLFKAKECSFEPCYKPLTENNTPKKITEAQIKKYCEYIKENMYGDIKSFNEYIGLKGQEYLDCSGLDLSEIDLSYASFNNADFSFCKFNGSDFYRCKMIECNFSGADFASYRSNKKAPFLGSKPDLSKIVTSMIEANFTGSKFDSADLTKVIASSANFDHTTAINLKAEGLILDKHAKAYRAYWPGAFLKNINANSLQAVGIDLSNSNCEGGIFVDAEISRSNFTKANCTRIDLEDGRADFSNFLDADLTEAKLITKSMSGSRLAIKADGATINTAMHDSDCSRLKSDKKEPNFVKFGSPLYDSEIDQFRLKQVDEEVRKNKLRIDKKYAYYAITAVTLLTLWVPLTISAFVPGLIPAVAMSAMISAASITLSTLVSDFALQKFFGRSPGINKVLTNIFGSDELEKISKENIELEKYKIKEKQHYTREKRQNLEQKVEPQVKEKTLERIKFYESKVVESRKIPEKKWTKGLDKKPASNVEKLTKERDSNLFTKYING